MNMSYDNDGIIDYPICAGTPQTFSPWRVTKQDQSPNVQWNDGNVVFNIGASDRIRSFTRLGLPAVDSKKGVIFAFKIAVAGVPVEIDLGYGLSLSVDSGGSSWRIAGTSYPTPIRWDGKTYNIVLFVTQDSISCMSDRGLGFIQKNTGVSEMYQPSIAVAKTGTESGSVTISDVYVMDQSIAPSTRSPWAYGFSSGELPDFEGLDIKTVAGGPAVSCVENAMRVSALPLKTGNSYATFTFNKMPSGVAVYTYKLRVNESSGSETKISFPGGFILRITKKGALNEVNWTTWRPSVFTTIADSRIVVGDGQYRNITIIVSGERYFMFEDNQIVGELSANSDYPSFSVQHLDVNCNVSVDFESIRVFPTIKSYKALAQDLQPKLMGFFPLRENLSCVMGEMNLRAENGTPAYAVGLNAPVASFKGSGCVLALPQMRPALAPSYTVSAMTKVRSLPPAGKRTAIAGGVLLDSQGFVVLNYKYVGPSGVAMRPVTSKNKITLGEWANVIVSFSHAEKRVTIYINGVLDSVTYLDPAECSEFAVIPCDGYVGGFLDTYGQPVVVLNGDVGDVVFLAGHIHQDSVNLLSLRPENPRNLLRIAPIAYFAGALAFAFIARVMYSNMTINTLYREQKIITVPTRESLPSVQEVVRRIKAKTGQPAVNRCSRADIDIPDFYRINLDIGGEGPWPENTPGREYGGFTAGIKDYINVNANMFNDQMPVAASHDNGPIPNLVYLKAWKNNPKLPFADNFADSIMMQGSPLMDYMVDEIARVIRNGGEINLWIDKSHTPQIDRLAKLVNSTVQSPKELDRFAGNVMQRADGSIEPVFVRKLIVARK